MTQPLKPSGGIVLAALLVSTAGCQSTRYDFEQPVVTGAELVNYESDLETCKTQVEAQLEQENSTESGGLVGAALGALATSGGDLQDMLGGAVIGAAVGAVTGNLAEDNKARTQVIDCMRQLGYNMADD